MIRRGPDLKPRKRQGHEANGLRRTAALLIEKVGEWDAELALALRNPVDDKWVEAIAQRRAEYMMIVDVLRAVVEGRAD